MSTVREVGSDGSGSLFQRTAQASASPSCSLASSPPCTPKRTSVGYVPPCGWNSPGFQAAGDGAIKSELSLAEEILAENGHFPSRLPPKRAHLSEGRTLSMQKRCRVCYRAGVRKETTYCCPKCPGQPGLCSAQCFSLFHGLHYGSDTFTPASSFSLPYSSPAKIDTMEPKSFTSTVTSPMLVKMPFVPTPKRKHNQPQELLEPITIKQEPLESPEELAAESNRQLMQEISGLIKLPSENRGKEHDKNY